MIRWARHVVCIGEIKVLYKLSKILKGRMHFRGGREVALKELSVSI
jgi:hypothetical protein